MSAQQVNTQLIKRLAGVAPEVDLKIVHHIYLHNANKSEPILALKNREQLPEIQNMGTSGPKLGHAKLKRSIKLFAFSLKADVSNHFIFESD